MSTNTDWFKGFGDIQPEVPTELAVLLIADCCELLDELKTWPAGTARLDLLVTNKTRHVVDKRWVEGDWDEIGFARGAIIQRLASMLHNYLRDRNNVH